MKEKRDLRKNTFAERERERKMERARALIINKKTERSDSNRTGYGMPLKRDFGLGWLAIGGPGPTHHSPTYQSLARVANGSGSEP